MMSAESHRWHQDIKSITSWNRTFSIAETAPTLAALYSVCVMDTGD